MLGPDLPGGAVGAPTTRLTTSTENRKYLTKAAAWKCNSKEGQPTSGMQGPGGYIFVLGRFLYWGWSSTKDHKKDVKMKHKEMQRNMDQCKKKKTKDEYREQYSIEIQLKKKERRKC